jgi:hypothetical protein
MIRQQFKNIFILLCLITINKFCYGQNLSNLKAINLSESLRQDFNIFRNTLEDNYPSIYRYKDKTFIDRLFDSCYSSINENTNDADLLRSMKFIYSCIQDGHLRCNASSQQMSYMEEKAKLFPLKLYFVGDRAFVRSNTIDSLPAGTEVISIDNKSIKQIRTELFKLMVSDGSIETKKFHIINSVFCFYYYMAYGEQSSYKVICNSHEKEIITIKVNGLTSMNIPAIAWNAFIPLLDLSINNNLAVLTIKTFNKEMLDGENIDFSVFLENSFKTINEKNITKLIIDLRDNGGGRGLYGSLLYSYLTNKSFNYYKSLTAATTNLPYSKFNITSTSFNNLDTAMLVKSGSNRFQLKKEANDNLLKVQPNKNNYKGKVWFLVNGLSFSTTAEFCAIASSKKRGKFIGEETGGGYYGNTSGVINDFILPNTKISFSFGLIEYEMAVTKAKFNDRGIIPDYIVIPTIADIMGKKDIQLEYVLKLANNSR